MPRTTRTRAGSPGRAWGVAVDKGDATPAMKAFPSRFRRLDDALADLPLDDPMLLTELDGYLTGIILCPDPITPEEWLPVIWCADQTEGSPFDDPADSRWFTDAVLARRNEIARDLSRGKLQPIFDVDDRNGEVLWEFWLEGFAQAMALRPDGWAAAGDADAAEALAHIDLLVAVARNESNLDSQEVNAVHDTAPADLIGAVLRLQRWRVRRGGAVASPSTDARPGKVGRNDPCPCGSGKKSKRCCG